MQIALADDHQLIRNSIKTLIESNGNYEVIIEAPNGLDLVAQLKTKKELPHICIIDISMGPLKGYETIQVIKKKWPQIRIIVLSIYEHELLITKMLRAGAASYLHKNCNLRTLYEAIDHTVTNGSYYTETVTKLIFRKINNKTNLEINDRELQFLCLCCTDLGYKEIAQKMKVGERTLENYRDSLFHKLDKHTRSGLALFATTTGLVNLSMEYLMNSKLLDKA